jgi:hypothetical protein
MIGRSSTLDVIAVFTPVLPPAALLATHTFVVQVQFITWEVIYAILDMVTPSVRSE